MTDLGYYGLEQDGFKLLIPIKKKKNLPLFDVEKKYNKMIGKIRVVIEHINSQLKTFKILSERYHKRSIIKTQDVILFFSPTTFIKIKCI